MRKLAPYYLTWSTLPKQGNTRNALSLTKWHNAATTWLNPADLAIKDMVLSSDEDAMFSMTLGERLATNAPRQRND